MSTIKSEEELEELRKLLNRDLHKAIKLIVKNSGEEEK